MKDVTILTGISLRRKESSTALKGAIELLKTSALSAAASVRRNALALGVASGAISFIGILLDLELTAAVMAMVSLLTLGMSEKGGRK